MRHPGTEHLLSFFDFSHHAPDLAEVSEPFANLATTLVNLLPDSPELTVGLRKLLEAKDCAVRCAVLKRSN